MFINLLEIIYPIGAFYISNNNTSPAELIGGEWEQIVGAVLRGDNEIGYTGQDTHTITVDEMPSHKHQASNRYFAYAAGGELNAATYGTAQKTTSAGDTAYTGGGNLCHSSNVPTIATFGAGFPDIVICSCKRGDC